MKYTNLLRLKRPKDDIQIAIPITRDMLRRIKIAAEDASMHRTYWASYVLLKELDALGIESEEIEEDED